MQIKTSEYNPELHDKYTALTVRQPYAQALLTPAYVDDDGVCYAEKSIEVRSRNIKYRGDIMICSSAKPVIPGYASGATIGLVELYDVKPISEFTDEDWENTCIPVNQRPQNGYGWLMRKPRPVVEMPVKGQLNVYTLIVPKDDITEYPNVCKMGKDGWAMIQKKIKDGESK